MTRNQAARVKQVNMDPHDSAEVQIMGTKTMSKRGGLKPLYEEPVQWKNNLQRQVDMTETNGITTIVVEAEPATTIKEHVQRQDDILTHQEQVEAAEAMEVNSEKAKDTQIQEEDEEEEMY